MTTPVFLKLKPSGRSDERWLVNVNHIQQIRPLANGVRIWWGVAMLMEEEGGSYVDSDDFAHSLVEIIEMLRQAQVGGVL